MIPYFEFTQIHLGPITLQVWGTLVALGILIGAWVSGRFAERNGLSKEVIYEGGFWIILVAMLGARAFHVLAYEPGFYLANPIDIFKVWRGGMSVTGGFLGAIVGYLLYVKKHKLGLLKYVNAFIYGLPIGLGVGRLGCFLVHDHPGTLTSFVLGVQQPDGRVIHDHGLYLSLNGFAMAILFFFLARQKRPPAFFAQVFLIWYGVVRFWLDFYRIIDTTYFGLTPAQYSSIVMVLAGIYWAQKSRKKA